MSLDYPQQKPAAPRAVPFCRRNERNCQCVYVRSHARDAGACTRRACMIDVRPRTHARARAQRHARRWRRWIVSRRPKIHNLAPLYMAGNVPTFLHTLTCRFDPPVSRKGPKTRRNSAAAPATSQHRLETSRISLLGQRLCTAPCECSPMCSSRPGSATRTWWHPGGSSGPAPCVRWRQ